MAYSQDILAGTRLQFGKNWRAFVANLEQGQIDEAERSLTSNLGLAMFPGKRFLDVGSGSGLFSLAARRLGSTVYSFDYDPQSVACAEYLKAKYFPDDPDWIISEGSALDKEFLERLGTFDVVYSWGVLHHTGAMWDALENVGNMVASQGRLFLSIYNDQGGATQVWYAIKAAYNRAPSLLRGLILGCCFLRLWGPRTLLDLVGGKPFRTWKQYQRTRGMSPWRDVVDWVGGYPFEVARPEQIFHFYRKRGHVLLGLKTCGGGHGCNEFVFEKLTPGQSPVGVARAL